MKIRNRLTLISSLTFGFVFIIASVLIYFAFYNSSEKVVFKELQKTCLLSAIYYLEKDELPHYEHSAIKEQFEENIQNDIVRVYDLNNVIVYGEKEADRNINPTNLNFIRKNKKLSFKSNNHFYYGIFYNDNQGDFVVFVKTKSEVFKSQTNRLLVIMIVVLFGGLFLIFLLSRLLSNIAYRPITNVINQVNSMELSSLDDPILSSNTNDEVQELIATFNNLLSRLSDTFAIQKNFINYVSHEFKTPLASISGNLEVFAQKDRTPEEYQKVTSEALENVYHIEEILNNLMMLSGLKTIHQENETFRIDETVWDINDQIFETHEKQEIGIDLDVKNEELLSVKGNEVQIRLALYNLIENAVKYSEGNPIKISLSEVNNQLQIIIEDYGKGILKEDLNYIQQTFYRGKNVGNIKGSGIGLSLATIIFKQNNIQFTIHSEENSGTRITLLFPKL
ncbi:sensor histidine kinase [Flavobacterium lindanitolerans]|jgi:two-component system sensor histidine kinase ArlS|uniref:histidine kinase n=1 Tax=Flavobacterium lindanitolerans TaxID=428988 RepID=A0A497UDI1_9FLAO|nr:HAMP domain-containing sensor histidine kinase [Flavobacterium lindanitolerans]PKW20686.1 signal transduction histidine kinase [Flavobacterium lindanitolerans]RLJ24129.1 signal transduction histidine kinase [Flavobacterium lindanitolerans]